MSPLLILALRVTAVLLLSVSAAAVLRRYSAALRHAALAAGLVGALLVGPLSGVTPSWAPLPLASPHGGVAVVASVDEAAVIADGASVIPAPAWGDVVMVAWAAGSGLSVLWLLVRLGRVRRHTRDGSGVSGHWTALLPGAAAELGVGRPVSIRIARGIAAPATWGWRWPVILLPDGAAAWAPARVRMVLLHELAHVARGDWPLLLLGELAVAVYWWHPLAWLVRARARKESECACDDLVLAGGVTAADYGTELVHLARHGQQAPRALVVGMAHVSSLERRITAMIDRTRDRSPLTRRAAIAVGAALLAMLAPIAAFSLQAQAPPQGLVVQVFDPSGAVLPGVTIALASEGRGWLSTTTEGSGRATFAEVPDGEYTLSASIQGFLPLKAPFAVRSARDRQRSITLQVGELEEVISVSAKRPTSPPPARGVVEPLRVGGNIKAPKKLRHVNPVYPASMRDAGLEGVVPMEVLIARDGSVTSVHVVSADVHPEFARAASDAVWQWQFSPTLLNGDAVEVRMTATVRFNLED